MVNFASMNVAVVILNWNGKQLLKKFLPSVLKFSNGANIYVADNNSTDDSIPFLQTTFPSVKIIKNKTNGGYAKGYNQALKNLQEDVFVLLNNDVKVTENWLKPFIEAFKTQPELVAAQPKILDFKNNQYFEYAGAAGGFIDALGYPFCRGRILNTIEKNNGQYNDNCYIFWASGACLAIKNEAFKSVNGFDEDLFTHQEEIDLCWRLHLKNKKIKYIAQSTVYHLGGATLQSSNPKKTFYNFRNTLLILLKNTKGNSVWFLIFIRLVLDGIAGVQFIVKLKPNHCLAIIKAHVSFYKNIPKYLKKRKLTKTTLRYYYLPSIIWSYYIKRKRTFKEL